MYLVTVQGKIKHTVLGLGHDFWQDVDLTYLIDESDYHKAKVQARIAAKAAGMDGIVDTFVHSSSKAV